MTIEGSGGGRQSDETRDREEERGDTGYRDASGEKQAGYAESLVHPAAARTDQQRLHEEQRQPGRRQHAVSHDVKRQFGYTQAASLSIAPEELCRPNEHSRIFEEGFEKEAG